MAQKVAALLLPALPEPVIAYEKRLAEDSRWALTEGSMHFEQKSAVQEALRKITERLNSLQIDYAVAGGMALFSHGLRRFTEDVDILVTREGLKTIHQALTGRGYVPPFTGSKNLRDTENGVRIEFLIAGEFPGDGRQKPVAFPEPQSVVLERDGIHYLNLPTLIELKLASGMTSAERIKDLADVQELIKLFALPLAFREALNPYVQKKYAELWRAAQGARKRYITIWQNRPAAAGVSSLSDLIPRFPEDAATLQEMQRDGIELDTERSRASEGYFVFMTTDPALANRYDMHDESEFWNGE